MFWSIMFYSSPIHYLKTMSYVLNVQVKCFVEVELRGGRVGGGLVELLQKVIFGVCNAVIN